MAGKILVGIAGLCYVTGLMVVTIHLGRYGLNSLILSQLHYVMAGIWAWIPIVLAMFLSAAATNSVFEEIERSKALPDQNSGRWAKLISKRYRGMASSVLGSLFAVAFGLWMFLRFAGIKFGWSWLLVLPAGAIVAFLLFGVGYGLSRPTSFKTIKSVVLTVSATFFCLLLFFGYLILFTRLSYQDIPWSTGGGGPSQVELVVAADAKPQLESVGIKFSTGQNRTDSLKLLLATEKEYIVINPDGKAISVPADSVKSVLYEK
ncbi:MAG TPA: hypothetical protein VGJ55_15195 [Pyrinomonadaceae bacterium]